MSGSTSGSGMPSPSTLIFPSIRDFSSGSAFLYQLTKILEFQLQHLSFQQVQGWFPLRLSDLVFLPTKGFSGVFSAPQFKGINSLVLHLLYVPSLITIRDRWEDHSFDYMDLCWQSNISAFQHAVEVCHSFPAKKQSSSDFMAAVMICSDFRAQVQEVWHGFLLFSF